MIDVKERKKGKIVSIYVKEKELETIRNLIEKEGLSSGEAIRKAIVQELAPKEAVITTLPKEEIIAAIDEKIESLKSELKQLLEAQNKRLQEVENLGVATSASMLSWWAKHKWKEEFKNFLKGRLKKD